MFADFFLSPSPPSRGSSHYTYVRTRLRSPTEPRLNLPGLASSFWYCWVRPLQLVSERSQTWVSGLKLTVCADAKRWFLEIMIKLPSWVKIQCDVLLRSVLPVLLGLPRRDSTLETASVRLRPCTVKPRTKNQARTNFTNTPLRDFGSTTAVKHMRFASSPTFTVDMTSVLLSSPPPIFH